MKKVATMHGENLKRLFKPIPIKTNYGFFDSLKDRNMTLKDWLDAMKTMECPLSVDKTCANFDCNFNYRLLHKLVITGEVD